MLHDEMVTLPEYLFIKFLKEANDIGHNGARVVDAKVLYGTAADGDPSIAFLLDQGPETATRSWEKR